MDTLYANKPREIDAYKEWIGDTDFSKYFDYEKANNEIAAQNKGAEPLYQPEIENTATKYNDYNQQITEQQEQKSEQIPSLPVQPKSAQDVLNDITSPFPDPVYNQERQDRLKRITKVNALGKGLSALGDIFSLSQGALVNQRQNDGRIDRLNQMYQSYDDDYDRRIDQHNRDKINFYLQQLREGRAEKRYVDEKEFREKQADQAQKNWEKNYEMTEQDRRERREDTRLDREERRKQQEAELKYRQQLPYVQHELQMKELEKRTQDAMKKEAAKVQMNKDQKGFKIYTSEGTEYANINTNGGIDALLSVILTDTNAKTELDALSSKFGESLSTEVKRYLVGKYWEKSPNAMKWVNNYKGTTSQENTQSVGNGNHETTPKQDGKNITSRNQIDYSQIKY